MAVGLVSACSIADSLKKRRYRRKPYKPISHDKLRETRILSGLSKKEAANMLFVTERTWHNWESGRIRVPYAVFKLLRILTGFDLPGEAWRGWSMLGDTLWSPEGKNFSPSDLNYLSLTFSMARLWRVDREEKRISDLRRKKSNLVSFVKPENGGKKISLIG
jgi:DNA-binding transcriptional regulator YiaG